MAKKATKAPEPAVSPETLKAALDLKVKGLITDEQFALMTGVPAPAPAPVAVAPAPAPVTSAVVSGSGNPGVVPALATGKAKLAALGGGAKPASKSKTPEVMIPELQADVEEFIAQLGAEKAAKGMREQAGERIAAKAEGHRVEISRKMGELQASIYLNKLVTFIQPHGYLMITPDKESALRQVFGAEYDGFIQPKMEIKVADEDALAAVYDDLEAICKSKGIDLSKMFAVKNTLGPTEALTAARVMRPDVAALFAKAAGLGLITPKTFTVKEK
jgi:hypothetical protein